LFILPFLVFVCFQDDPPLIDVRDLNEVVNGIIPTAHHIPLSDLEAALALDDEAFKAQYGFDKFGKDDEVVFYCRSGRRSNLAWQLTRGQGYTRVRNYPGSWIEYEAKGGVKGKLP
jgi:rhodanese-related sulfurtransferase